MKLEIDIHQMKDVLMFFENSPLLKLALQLIILLGCLSVISLILAVAWRISGL